MRVTDLRVLSDQSGMLPDDESTEKPAGRVFAFEDLTDPTIYGEERVARFVEALPRSGSYADLETDIAGDVIGVGTKTKEGEWTFTKFYPLQRSQRCH